MTAHNQPNEISYVSLDAWNFTDTIINFLFLTIIDYEVYITKSWLLQAGKRNTIINIYFVIQQIKIIMFSLGSKVKIEMLISFKNMCGS